MRGLAGIVSAIATPATVGCTPDLSMAHHKSQQADRNMLAHQRERAECKCGIGGDGYAPADQGVLRPVEQGVDQRGHEHTAEGAEQQHASVFRMREFPRDHFSFDLETKQEKENRHQAIVDDVFEWRAQLQAADIPNPAR